MECSDFLRGASPYLLLFHNREIVLVIWQNAAPSAWASL
jgi:hypothetical protein